MILEERDDVGFDCGIDLDCFHVWWDLSEKSNSYVSSWTTANNMDKKHILDTCSLRKETLENLNAFILKYGQVFSTN